MSATGQWHAEEEPYSHEEPGPGDMPTKEWIEAWGDVCPDCAGEGGFPMPSGRSHKCLTCGGSGETPTSARD